MKITRLLSVVGITLCLGILLVACKSSNTKDISENDVSSNRVSLDFLITPDQLRMYSNNQLIELNRVEDKGRAHLKSINEKYDDLSKMSEKDIEIQGQIIKESQDALNSAKVIEDKSTIENILNQFRELEGIYIDSFEEFKEDEIVRIDLTDDGGIVSLGSSENSYLGSLKLLQDGNMIIPKPISKTPTEIEYIKVKLPEELRYELEELAQN